MIDLENRKIKKSTDNYYIISPSYSCTSQLTKIEALICKSTNLSNLDLILSTAYKANTVKSKKADQRQWLKKRNMCATEKDIQTCLVKMYNKRIKSLISY